MHGKTPHEAIGEYTRTLQRALPCVTREILRPSGRQPAGAHVLFLPHKALPHLHLGQALQLRPDFTNLHVPTERVALEDVLAFLIDELGVQPREDDWRVILAETRRAFEGARTWPRSGGMPPAPPTE